VNTPCVDCAVNTHPWEQFMVTDDVWRQAGDVRGDLCVQCLEERIGRELEHDDFRNLPLNDDRELDSVRLRLRKGSGRCSEPLYVLARDAVTDLGVDLELVATKLDLEPGLLRQWVENKRVAQEVLSAA
jgi:hypothetical protein